MTPYRREAAVALIDIEHNFGGRWTQVKLQRLGAYLPYFTTEFGDGFRTYYFDGFAGTGLVHRKQPVNRGSLIELPYRPPLAGSALLAMTTEPAFGRYVLVDTNEQHCRQLRTLVKRMPELDQRANVPWRQRDEGLDYPNKVNVKRGDANEWAERFCGAIDWERSRGVFVLDPYGTALEWKTLDTIAKTKAADVWYLFPTSAALRLLSRKHKPQPGNCRRLHRLFGSDAWLARFYHTWEAGGAFKPIQKTTRNAPARVVNDYVLERLKGTFPYVSGRPLRLLNNQESTLFHLHFASSIPGHRRTHAVVEDILRVSSKERKFTHRFAALLAARGERVLTPPPAIPSDL